MRTSSLAAAVAAAVSLFAPVPAFAQAPEVPDSPQLSPAAVLFSTYQGRMSVPPHPAGAAIVRERLVEVDLDAFRRALERPSERGSGRIPRVSFNFFADAVLTAPVDYDRLVRVDGMVSLVWLDFGSTDPRLYLAGLAPEPDMVTAAFAPDGSFGVLAVVDGRRYAAVPLPAPPSGSGRTPGRGAPVVVYAAREYEYDEPEVQVLDPTGAPVGAGLVDPELLGGAAPPPAAGLGRDDPAGLPGGVRPPVSAPGRVGVPLPPRR